MVYLGRAVLAITSYSILLTPHLPFRSCEGDAFDKLLLGDEENDDGGDYGHERRRHHVVELSARLVDEETQANGQRTHLGGVGHNQRPEIVVPEAEENEEGDGGQCRA